MASFTELSMYRIPVSGSSHHGTTNNDKPKNDKAPLRSLQRILLLVAVILSCYTQKCEATQQRNRGVRILGAPASSPRVLEGPGTDHDNPQPETKTRCRDAKDCGDCIVKASAVTNNSPGRTCWWSGEGSVNGTKTCQGIKVNETASTPETMCEGENEGGSDNHSQTSSPTSPKPEKELSTKGVDVVDTPKAPTMKPSKAPSQPTKPASEPSEHAGEPTTKKPSPEPTQKPTLAPSPESKPEKKPNDDDKNGTISVFMLGDFGPKQIGGITFGVVLLILWFRCCRRTSAVDSQSKGGTVIPPRATPSTYSRVAMAEPIEEDNSDDWGWDDNNIGNSASGDLEMSQANTQLPVHGKASPPPPVSKGSSRVTGGVALQPAPTPTPHTRAGITLSSRVNKKPSPAKTVKDPDDFFSEMGLAAKPKFGKPAGPRKLGAVPLPKDSDDWGDDDGLDDLLKD